MVSCSACLRHFIFSLIYIRIVDLRSSNNHRFFTLSTIANGIPGLGWLGTKWLFFYNTSISLSSLSAWQCGLASLDTVTRERPDQVQITTSRLQPRLARPGLRNDLMGTTSAMG